jgi:hypothetical protein
VKNGEVSRNGKVRKEKRGFCSSFFCSSLNAESVLFTFIVIILDDDQERKGKRGSLRTSPSKIIPLLIEKRYLLREV